MKHAKRPDYGTIQIATMGLKGSVFVAVELYTKDGEYRIRSLRYSAQTNMVPTVSDKSYAYIGHACREFKAGVNHLRYHFGCRAVKVLPARYNTQSMWTRDNAADAAATSCS